MSKYTPHITREFRIGSYTFSTLDELLDFLDCSVEYINQDALAPLLDRKLVKALLHGVPPGLLGVPGLDVQRVPQVEVHTAVTFPGWEKRHGTYSVQTAIHHLWEYLYVDEGISYTPQYVDEVLGVATAIKELEKYLLTSPRNKYRRAKRARCKPWPQEWVRRARSSGYTLLAGTSHTPAYPPWECVTTGTVLRWKRWTELI